MRTYISKQVLCPFKTIPLGGCIFSPETLALLTVFLETSFGIPSDFIGYF